MEDAQILESEPQPATSNLQPQTGDPQPFEEPTKVVEEASAVVPRADAPQGFQFNNYKRVDFSPKYYESIMSLYGGSETLGDDEKQFSPTELFATEAATEFNARYPGMGTYIELSEGTSKFLPGVPMTDTEILLELTTMEEKGFLESLTRRSVENIPGVAAFSTGFASGKRAAQLGPVRLPQLPGPLQKFSQAAETAYVAGKFALPYITGIASSVLAFPYQEKFGEIFLGDKKLPTPETYSTMRSAQAVADVATFAPLGYFASNAASNTLRDYFVNRLTFQGKRADSSVLDGAIARDFDFSDMAKMPFSKQYKEALKITGSLGKRSGVPVQGVPLTTINEMNTRGVSAILQGKVAPNILRKLSVIENAIKQSGKDAQKNPALFAFYESIAAGGAYMGAKSVAETSPFSVYEDVAEISGSVVLPMFSGQLLFGIAGRLKPYARNLRENIGDRGVIKGTLSSITQGAEQLRSQTGFKMILDTLDEFGTLDSPESQEALIKALEALPADPQSKPTAGMLSKNPAIMAMEEALARDNESLSNAQKIARQREKRVSQLVLENLSVGEETPGYKDALRMAAEVEQAIFESILNKRLTTAESNLLDAYSQLKKLNPKALEQIKGPEGETLSTEVLANLNDADRIDLSTRLVNMLTAQKGFARGQQRTLYAAVGQMDINNFFTDTGQVADLPKFLAVLKEEGGAHPNSKVGLELKQLYAYAQDLSNRMGYGVDLGVDSPKFTAYDEARVEAFGEGGMSFFDTFVEKNIGAVDELNMPETVTPEMVTAVSDALRGRKNNAVTTVYKTFRSALIEKGTRQGTINPRARTGAAKPAEVSRPETSSALSLRDLQKLRGDALADVRDGNKSPESRRIAGMLASAIEDDLINFAEYGGTEQTKKQMDALRTANNYTKAFADVYYRSFVGDALEQTRKGGFRMAPETMAESFNRNQFDPNYLKVLDIQKVGEFAQEQGIANAGESINSISGVMEKILRSARAEAYDPETKNINQKKLNDWIKANARLEGLFPDLFADLKQFEVAKETLGGVVAENSRQRNVIKEQINFTAFLKTPTGAIRTNPTAAIAEAMSAGKDQLLSLDALLSVIPKKGEIKKQNIYTLTDPETSITTTYFTKKEAESALSNMPINTEMSERTLSVDREQAMEGFKSSLFEYFVFGNPGGRASKGGSETIEGIQFNPIQVYNDLFEKKLIAAKAPGSISSKAGLTTMSEFMIKKGVSSEREMNITKAALEKLARIQMGELTGQLATDFAEAAPLLDFAVSIFGSAVGTRTQSVFTGGTGGPGSIIAAGKGAEAARNIFLRMPRTDRMLFAADLLQNPRLLSKMLRQYGTDGQRKGITDSLLDYLKKGGFSVLPRRIFVGSDEKLEPVADTTTFDPRESSPFPAIPRADESELQQDSRDQSSLQVRPQPQPPLNEALPPVRQATVPNGVQTATATAPVDPVGTTGIASWGGTSRIDPERARAFFDSPGEIIFAARGGEMRSGIGGLLR